MPPEIPMPPRRGPTRFLGDEQTPAAYRQLDPTGEDAPLQVRALLTATEYDLEDYRSRNPILVIHGDAPGATLSSLRLGLNLFAMDNDRPTWLAVTFFDGKTLIPLEPVAEGPPIKLSSDTSPADAQPPELPRKSFWKRLFGS